MTALLTALILSAADPCTPVEAAAVADPATAAMYRDVGAAERKEGSTETATVAYRTALALDPTDEVSRRALVDLCSSQGQGTTPFERGIARMQVGDLRSAIGAFEDARAARPDASAALLEGVCWYELGEDRRARELLREAEAAPVHHDTADLYLGLIALREGNPEEATSLLDAAAENRALAPIALDLARLARTSQRLVLSLITESGLDSNAQLAPTQTPIASTYDAMFGITASALYRPVGESGPYLRASGLYRQQVRFGDLDYGGASAAAGWQLGTARRGVLGEYDFDYRVLGGSSFLTAHRLTAAGWLPVGRVTLGASYFARFESYPGALYAPFSGTFQRAEATSAVPLGVRASLSFGYRLLRDGVERTELSWTEHGPAAELRYRLAPRLRVGAAMAISFRGYDALDTTLGVTRSDTYLDATALAEWDVASHWTMRFSIDGRNAFSNASGFAYFRIVPVIGLAYVVGM